MYAKKLHNKSLEFQIQNIMKRILKFMEPTVKEKILTAINQSARKIDSNNNMLSSIESMIYDGQFVCITYLKRNNILETTTVVIKEIIENNDDIFIVCREKTKTRNKKINVKSIISISQSPERVSDANLWDDSVIYKVYGRLVKSYKLKKGEKTLDYSADYMTISNTGEDKDVLLKRLLKYGENCQIIKPQELKDDFISLTDEILKNLNGETV